MKQDKIKIAYIVSSLVKQGPVQVVYDIISNIDFNYFEITIITLKSEQDSSLINLFKIFPIKIIQIDYINKYNIIKLLSEIKNILKQENIQITHSHCFRSLLINSLLGNDIIKIHTIHNYPQYLAIAMHGQLIGITINIISKLCLKRMNYPIACSESIKKQFEINDKLSVVSITNGVSFPAKNELNKAVLKKSLGLNPKYEYFISVGRFSKEKNFKFLTEAFLEVKPNNYKLIILGDGPLFDEIKSIANDTIILTGFKTNVSDYLQASNYYISASLSEGMPLSVLEAMSCGLGLILSDINPHKEIINKDTSKKIGVLFSNDKENDIIQKLKEILTYDILKLKENSIACFNENFTSQKMSEQYQRIYKDSIIQI